MLKMIKDLRVIGCHQNLCDMVNNQRNENLRGPRFEFLCSHCQRQFPTSKLTCSCALSLQIGVIRDTNYFCAFESLSAQ